MKNLLKRFGIILVFFTLHLQASSQEYIYGCDFIEGFPTIVREVSIDKWLFCQRSPFSSFFYVSDTSSWVHTLDFSGYNIAINDFEIYNDWVFFCGESTNPNDSYAFVGKFNMTSYPNSTVYFYKTDKIKSLTKIEVQNGGLATVDAFMIGQGHNGECFFVSANLPGFGNLGSFFFSEATDFHVNILDDIVITDNYIVATGRDTINRQGYLYYFYIPVLIGGPYATFTQYFNIGYDVFNPILITHCTNDYIVTVSSNNSYHLISAFDSTSNIHNMMISRVNGVVEKDLDYNSNSKELDLLVNNYAIQQDGCVSYIYHLSPTNVTDGTTFYVHDYTGHKIFSIRKTSETIPLLNRFIAGGCPCVSFHFHWYRYNSHQWWACAQKTIKKIYESKRELDINRYYTYNPENKEIEPIVHSKRIRKYEYDSYCPEKNSNSEE